MRAAMSPSDAHQSVASDVLHKDVLSTVFDIVEHIENFQLHNA